MDSSPQPAETTAVGALGADVTAANTRQVELAQPPTKKQRVLKMTQSDEQQLGDDTESASLGRS